MDPSTAERLIANARAGGQYEDIWAAYKKVWENGVNMPMDSSIFSSLFGRTDLSKDAVKFAGRFREACALLAEAALQVSAEDLTNSARQRVFAAVVGAADLIDRWRNMRDDLDISGRTDYAGNIIKIIAKQKGRACARQTTKELWDEFTLEAVAKPANRVTF